MYARAHIYYDTYTHGLVGRRSASESGSPPRAAVLDVRFYIYFFIRFFFLLLIISVKLQYQPASVVLVQSFRARVILVPVYYVHTRKPHTYRVFIDDK